MLSCSAIRNTEIPQLDRRLAIRGQFPIDGFDQRLYVAGILDEISFPDP